MQAYWLRMGGAGVLSALCIPYTGGAGWPCFSMGFSERATGWRLFKDGPGTGACGSGQPRHSTDTAPESPPGVYHIPIRCRRRPPLLLTTGALSRFRVCNAWYRLVQHPSSLYPAAIPPNSFSSQQPYFDGVKDMVALLLICVLLPMTPAPEGDGQLFSVRAVCMHAVELVFDSS